MRESVTALVAGRAAEIEGWVKVCLGHPRLRRLPDHRLRPSGRRVRLVRGRRASGALRLRPRLHRTPAGRGRGHHPAAAFRRSLPRRQGRRPHRRPDPVRVRLGRAPRQLGRRAVLSGQPAAHVQRRPERRPDRGDRRGLRDRPRGAPALAEPLRGGAGRDGPAGGRRLVHLQRAGARARGAPVPRAPPAVGVADGAPHPHGPGRDHQPRAHRPPRRPPGLPRGPRGGRCAMAARARRRPRRQAGR